ncbi:Semaphorin-1A like protein [Argiope bruennichi]|uniref:Semaphorin-1A like protein n=1 Tax=Argiope bruennichi TaxID=94029 RepID=A0A8T0G2J2_ARGBR|nr:Semaphorin-1A like protein [Argiope bruennichi]
MPRNVPTCQVDSKVGCCDKAICLGILFEFGAFLPYGSACVECCGDGVLLIGFVWQRCFIEESDLQRFIGNESYSDYFKLLEQDADSLLVGARNIVYNISLQSLQEQKRLEWFSATEDIGMCRLKGKSEEECQNYIRVLARKSEDTILVCGTNAFKPMCRNYKQTPTDYIVTKEQSGEGLCPYDPNHNSTAIFAGPLGQRTDGDLYVATVAQFSGADPLIYREPLRTEQFNFEHLNAPSFVSSIHHGDYVYFFFRETAVEYINCGKAVYSRVARVCTKDKGGPHKFRNRWTSFLKARLNCSLPGEFPFYFNEILIIKIKITIIEIRIERLPSTCVALRDPYCAWDMNQRICTSSKQRILKSDKFVQNIVDGWDARCPEDPKPSTSPITGRPLNKETSPQRSPHQSASRHDNHLGGRPTPQEDPDIRPNIIPDAPDASRDYHLIYTAETLAIAVTSSIVSSLVVGFISGYIFSRRCRNEEIESPYDEGPYLEQQHNARMDHRNLDTFLPATVNNKPINLVLNVPPKSGKTANSSADNKPIQKVKKIYL